MGGTPRPHLVGSWITAQGPGPPIEGALRYSSPLVLIFQGPPLRCEYRPPFQGFYDNWNWTWLMGRMLPRLVGLPVLVTRPITYGARSLAGWRDHN